MADQFNTLTRPREDYTKTTAPTAADDGSANGGSWGVGSRWYNTSTSRLYFCTDATTGAAVWKYAALT